MNAGISRRYGGKKMKEADRPRAGPIHRTRFAIIELQDTHGELELPK